MAHFLTPQLHQILTTFHTLKIRKTFDSEISLKIGIKA